MVDEDLADCDLTEICTDPSATIDDFSFDCVNNDTVTTEENVRPEDIFFCFYDESVLVASQGIQIQGYNLWVEAVNADTEGEVSLFVWEGYFVSSELSEGWYGSTVEIVGNFRLDVVTPQEPEKFDALFATGFVEFHDTGEGMLEPIAIAPTFEIQSGQGESEQGCIEHLQDF